MTFYDLYLISPQLAVAGTGILVILLDLVFQRKGFLPYAAFAGLLVAVAFLVIQSIDLADATDLVADGDTRAAGVLAGSLSVDRFSLFFNFLVLAALGLVTLSSVDYVKRMENYRGEYFGLMLFSATGMMLLASATELITIYISLELVTLPLAALSAFLMTSRSSEAGMKFLIVGAISSAVMLYGMALVYGFTGGTKLDEIAEVVKSAAVLDVPFGGYALLVGVVLMLVGFGFKISAVPFQMWVPDVYEGAPTPVVAFLSVASKAAAVAVLIRVLFTGFFPIALDWASLIAVLAAASAQMSNFYGIPSGVLAGMSDSKLPDNQAGFEKAITDLTAGFAGAKRRAVSVDDTHILVGDRLAHRSDAARGFRAAGDPSGFAGAEALDNGNDIKGFELLPVADQERRRGRGDIAQGGQFRRRDVHGPVDQHIDHRRIARRDGGAEALDPIEKAALRKFARQQQSGARVERAEAALPDFDLIEMNEAFSVQMVALQRKLEADPEKWNVHGGAVALGHPIGATGSILIGTMVDELERQGKRYGLVTMCAAGGMAPAIIVERVDDFVD